MREVERIDRILEKIGELWKHYPDQRLFQLLFNYTQLGTRDKIGTVRDPFHYEDTDIETQLDDILKQISDILKQISGVKE